MPELHQEIQELKDRTTQQEHQIQQLYQLIGGFQDKLMNLEAFVSNTPFTKAGNEDIIQ